MLEPLKSKPEKKINLSLTEFVFPKTRSKKLTGVSKNGEKTGFH